MRVYQFFEITSASTASVAENTADFSYTITASKTSTFTLGTAKDERLFNLNGSELSFKTALDFENPTDGNTDNIYEIKITATSGGESITKDVKITVTNVVEAPVFSSTMVANENVAENTSTATVVYTASVSDVSTKDAVTFSLQNPSTAVTADDDNAQFTIDGSTGVVKFKAVPNFENPADADGKNDYNVRITATAGASTAGTKSVTKNVVITVTDIDEIAQRITSAATASVPENTTNFTYTITASEAATFALGTAGGDKALFNREGATEGKNTLSVTGKGVLVTGIEPARAIVPVTPGRESGKTVFPGLSVFPNPAADVLNVKFPNQNRPVALQLTDVNGQVVYEREAVTSDELSLDV